jgi:hypothetical protein
MVPLLDDDNTTIQSTETNEIKFKDYFVAQTFE